MRLSELSKFDKHPVGPAKFNGDKNLKFENIIRPKLEANCKEIIGIYKQSGRFLYRGLNARQDSLAARIRTNRLPLEMPNEEHEAANKAILSLGLSAHRGNSIFCTTSINRADGWGRVYIAFPLDGWSVTFMEKQSDWYMFNIIQNAGWFGKPSLLTQTLAETFKKYGISGDKNKMISNMKRAGLGGGHAAWEYLIAGHSYIALEKHAYQDKLVKWLGI